MFIRLPWSCLNPFHLHFLANGISKLLLLHIFSNFLLIRRCTTRCLTVKELSKSCAYHYIQSQSLEQHHCSQYSPKQREDGRFYFEKILMFYHSSVSSALCCSPSGLSLGHEIPWNDDCDTFHWSEQTDWNGLSHGDVLWPVSFSLSSA